MCYTVTAGFDIWETIFYAKIRSEEIEKWMKLKVIKEGCLQAY